MPKAITMAFSANALPSRTMATNSAWSNRDRFVNVQLTLAHQHHEFSHMKYRIASTCYPCRRGIETPYIAGADLPAFPLCCTGRTLPASEHRWGHASISVRLTLLDWFGDEGEVAA